jgi:hypothetical protein
MWICWSSFAKKAGLEIDFIEIDEWNNLWLKPSLEEADVSIGGIGISDKRTNKNTQWTISYFYVQRTSASCHKWLRTLL